jgi:hypothetical protein
VSEPLRSTRIWRSERWQTTMAPTRFGVPSLGTGASGSSRITGRG